MLMSIGAFQAAELIIKRGQNSLLMTNTTGYEDSAYQSFKGLAEQTNQTDAYKLIDQVLNRQEQYSHISIEQAAALVKRTMSLRLAYPLMLDKLDEALSLCSPSTMLDSIPWGQALALYTGSIEGMNEGGSFDNKGEMMFSLAKEVCHTFNTCADNGDSSRNSEIMNAFRDGAGYLKTGDCNALEDVASQIKALTQTVLIQAVLYFLLDSSKTPWDQLVADRANPVKFGSDVDRFGINSLNSDTDRTGLAEVSVIAQALYPVINATDPSSTSVIMEATDFVNIGYGPMSQARSRSEQVFDAFETLIPSMIGVDCSKVGSVILGGKTIGVCPTNDTNTETFDTSDLSAVVNTPIDQGESHEISNGLYQTVTNVKDRTYISQDVLDISKALLSRNFNLARNIYTQGLNSDLRDEDGML